MVKRTILTMAVVVIILSLISLAISFYESEKLRELTGRATDTGTANLSIISQASISFITNSVNWGTGRVNESAGSAYLDSEGNVVNGNWTQVIQGLTVRNEGNQHVQLNLSTSNTANTFIGGASPSYKIKVTENQTGSCPSGLASTYATATGVNQPGCSNLTYFAGLNSLDIDINLTIPQDATPGAKGSIITANALVLG